MTEQTKRFIAVSDIVGLRFECAHEGCGATLILPFKAEALKIDTLVSCPGCGREWAVERKTGEKGADSRSTFKGFVQAAEAVSGARPRFHFSLEITPPLTSGSEHRASE
jgi:hypothetical protein